MNTGPTRGLGAFCLVLHAHLPWVLGHGRWPHGEAWLHDAAMSCWQPLLGVLDRLAAEGVRPGWSVGLTPILVEQLAHPRFHSGYADFLVERGQRAADDARDPALRATASRWQRAADAAGEAFSRRDLLTGYRVHRDQDAIEILGSNATHGYHPLLRTDAAARAQIRCGVHTHVARLGRAPAGAWWPECAYRPAGRWASPAIPEAPSDHLGTAALYAASGFEYAVIDGGQLQRGDPAWRRATTGRWRKARDARRSGPYASDMEGWLLDGELHRVAEAGRPTPLGVIARNPEVSAQVWSADLGYPGDGRYLEFHKRVGADGWRYWAVTSRHTDLGGKQPYDAEVAVEVARGHAAHYAKVIKGKLLEHRARTGRYGVVCAAFDAELFGHWWHEGPVFLEALARLLHADREVDLCTVGEAFAASPPDKAVTLPESSWGDGGDHRVWWNDELRWVWEVEHRAEARLNALLGRAKGRARRWLVAAARELLLLQASDWPFVIHTRGAVDYGWRRLSGHATRFEDLCNGADDRLAGRPVDPVTQRALRDAETLPMPFPDLDLRWWRDA